MKALVDKTEILKLKLKSIISKINGLKIDLHPWSLDREIRSKMQW